MSELTDNKLKRFAEFEDKWGVMYEGIPFTIDMLARAAGIVSYLEWMGFVHLNVFPGYFNNLLITCQNPIGEANYDVEIFDDGTFELYGDDD